MTRMINPARARLLAFALALGGTAQMAAAETAYLEITLKIGAPDRAAAAAVYAKYKTPFLETVHGARAKHLLLRDDDVQVLHEFASVTDAQDYLASALFTTDVVGELKPLLAAEPEIRIYSGD